MHILSKKISFPPVDDAQSDGLLAMGGDLSPERILYAYQHGIFPWFEGDTPLWWCPDPRFVLFLENLVISKSMLQLIKKNHFQFKTNTSFSAIINNCKTISRNGQAGTWITKEVETAYTHLHHLGHAHCAETWLNGELVGGLYGIRIGNVFFGESMYSKVNNASKFAFILYVELLKKEGVKLIDCQVYTSHLESLGATMITRKKFIELLKDHGALL